MAVEGEGLKAGMLAKALVIRGNCRVGRALHRRHLPAVNREADEDVSQGEFVAGHVGTGLI